MRGIVKTSLLMVFALLLAIFIKTADVSQAQDIVCPADLACPEIILSPATMTGDIFLNEQLLAGGQNRLVLNLPPGQTHQIVVRNIQNPGEAGFGQLFVYQETSVSVNLAAGRTRQYTLYPRQQFIRGTLNHTCDVRSRAEGEDVSCQIIVDGVDFGVFPAGEVRPFIFDPGQHVVRVQLVGGSVSLWEPNVKEQNTNITAGRTSTLRTRFDKRAHLILAVNQPGVVGDFFVNEVLIASQVPGADLYIAPNERQNIAVRNLTATSVGMGWGEGASSITLGANQERTVTLRLQAVSLVDGDTWTVIPATAPVNCENGTSGFVGVSEPFSVRVSLARSGSTVSVFFPTGGSMRLTEASPNVYTGTDRNADYVDNITVTFFSPTEFAIDQVITYTAQTGCGNLVDFAIPRLVFRR